jgi:hypothetical protein
MEMLSIERGRIIIYRLFDIASEIDLSLIESKTREGTKRLRLSKYPYMKALEFANPPVSFELRGFVKSLFGQDTNVNVIAKAYDFGVLSIAFYIPIPQNSTFNELETEAEKLNIDESIDEKAKDYISHLINSLGNAIISPGIKENFIEDYTIFLIEKLGKEMEASEFLKLYDPSRLLLYETHKVSLPLREETLKHRFSYYPEDLVIVHHDNAFIIEPSGSSDILDILEFANAQILELRYYDHVIDKELTRIYSELPKRTEVTEKVDNALKVTEDVYYARIYRTAMMLFRSRDWELSIKEKLQIVTNTYKMLYNEIVTKRGHLIELGIFLLIAIEIIILLVIEL